MKKFLIAALFFGLALSGCISDDDSDLETGGPNRPGDGFVSVGAYKLDCSWESALGEPCLVLASPNESPSKTEIDVVVNPTDPMNVIVASKDLDPLASPCVWAVSQVTKDGGQTWETVYLGGALADRQVGDFLYGWDCITDPIMAFNEAGDLFYNLQVYRITGEPPVPVVEDVLLDPDTAMMAIAISHDGGMTYPEMYPQMFGDDFTVFPDYMRMGSNPQTGSAYVLWNTIVGLATSNPTFSGFRDGAPIPPTPIITPTAPTGLGESAVIGANDGTVYVCLCGFNSGGEAYWTTSSDDGLTFDVPTKAFDFVPMANSDNASFRIGTAVEVGIDNSHGERDGCLYAVWAGNEADAIGGSDLYSRSSCDGGVSWTEPVLVNEARENAQFFPRITVDGRGGVHVVYHTQAYDPENRLVDTEWAFSDDGGQTWNNTRLTTISSDGDLGVHQNGGPFFGDYIGIDSAGDHVWMAFPHTATGVAEIAVAHVTAV